MGDGSSQQSCVATPVLSPGVPVDFLTTSGTPVRELVGESEQALRTTRARDATASRTRERMCMGDRTF